MPLVLVKYMPPDSRLRHAGGIAVNPGLMIGVGINQVTDAGGRRQAVDFVLHDIERFRRVFNVNRVSGFSDPHETVSRDSIAAQIKTFS